MTSTNIASSAVTLKRLRVMEPAPGVTKREKIAQGAEGIVYRCEFLGRAAIEKVRLPKTYRHPQLDARLTSRRLAQEARALLRLRKCGIRVPAVYFAGNGYLVMQDMKAPSLRRFLETSANHSTTIAAAGEAVAKMHRADVVHGDLTTSNLLVCDDGGICIIDFGLSSTSSSDEDMAVDLYVLERAILSTRPQEANVLNSSFLTAYKNTLDRPSVLRRLEDVRARGRKRDMTG